MNPLPPAYARLEILPMHDRYLRQAECCLNQKGRGAAACQGPKLVIIAWHQFYLSLISGANRYQYGWKYLAKLLINIEKAEFLQTSTVDPSGNSVKQ